MKRPRTASFPRAVRRVLVMHARQAAPEECCGLLVGTGRRVEFAIPMTNVDARPRTGFRLDPREHIAVRRSLRQLSPDLEILGVYHSHPAGPAIPSDRDVKEANYPDWLYVIVGRAGRAVRTFTLRSGKVLTVKMSWRR